MEFNLHLLYMLKAKMKRSKTKLLTSKRGATTHHGFYRAKVSNSGMANSSAVPRPMYGMGGGIAYMSSLENYGITNKPPYYLESLIAKMAPQQYVNPALSQTSSVLMGPNVMTKGANKNTMEEQTKTQSVEYVDLVAPVKSQDETTQPDWVLTSVPQKSQGLLPVGGPEPPKGLSNYMAENNPNIQLKSDKSQQDSRLKEIKRNIEKRIAANRESKIPRHGQRLRGKKNKDEL